MTADHTHVVSNGKRRLTLDELAVMQPGLDRLMAEVGPRMHRLYHAARAGNWPLAEYFFRSVVKQLRLCATSRPKYAEDIDRYLAEDTPAVREALRAQDSDGFHAAYASMVDRANDYHVSTGKPFIRWVTPTSPPDDLDLTAGVEAP
ncbi:MAG TPA: hypothetical protein VNG13_02170 [Mycobacteriales bacterium]|nr:hypothetical protein [Mycobacteriales bacterium]